MSASIAGGTHRSDELGRNYTNLARAAADSRLSSLLPRAFGKVSGGQHRRARAPLVRLGFPGALAVSAGLRGPEYIVQVPSPEAWLCESINNCRHCGQD